MDSKSRKFSRKNKLLLVFTALHFLVDGFFYIPGLKEIFHHNAADTAIFIFIGLVIGLPVSIISYVLSCITGSKIKSLKNHAPELRVVMICVFVNVGLLLVTLFHPMGIFNIWKELQHGMG